MIKNKKFNVYLISAITIILLLIIIALVLITTVTSQKESDKLIDFSTEEVADLKDSSDMIEKIYVDIKGAVKSPGMYEAKREMRVWDAVMLAGGLTEDADRDQLNFSERIADQMVVRVPEKGEEVIPKDNSQSNTQETPTETDKINLNSASESELMELSGIGQKKAQDIIKYREDKGGFKALEELKKISGIGDKIYEKLKEQISI